MPPITPTLTAVLKEPAKASVLWKLRTGRAYTAIELANDANVSKNQINAHLTALIDAGLVVEIIRRKRSYYRLFNDDVSQTLRTHYLETSLPESELAEKHNPKGMKYCRTCYNHLAGQVGVKVTESLRHQGFIKIGKDNHFTLTSDGQTFFGDFGIDTIEVDQKQGRFAKACIDFSERKYHLGGALGKAFFDKMEEKKWVSRIANAREVNITRKGKKAFANVFKLNLEAHYS